MKKRKKVFREGSRGWLRQQAKEVLKKNGQCPNGSTISVASRVAKILGIPLSANPSKAECYDVYRKAADKPAVSASPASQRAILQKKIDDFYRSYEWRKLRLVIIKQQGRRCLCCGATPEDGIKIHVDHIRPLRFFWDLRLDPENLQVLCEICNHGKGNWDRTDWREKK